MKNRFLRTIAMGTLYCTITIQHTTHAMEKILEIQEIARKEVRLMEKIIAPKLEQELNGEQPAIANNPYKNTTAFVTHNPGISDGEKAFLQNREPIVKEGLEKLLNCSLDNKRIPKISIVCSGGGYRSDLCTIGWLNGVEKIGLLKCTTHIVTLSGSTWAVAPWISSGLPIKKFKQYVQDCVAKPLHEITQEEKILIADARAVKIIYDQPRTFVDPYGDLLANRLLAYADDKRHMIYLSDQAKKIELGAYPYPIYTAIDGREDVIENQPWYSYTPHTVSDDYSNNHIPTWAYGRKFENGESMNNAPEKPLGYLMGTWGSAFAANIHTMLQKVDKSETLEKRFNLSVELKGHRLLPFWSEIPNYMHGMNSNNKQITLPEKDHIKFVDAGLSRLNLPYPVVSGICPERKADILIFFDASGGQVGKQLKRVAEYALRHKLPFPKIDLTDVDKKTVSIFKDEHNPLAPLVIYMPRISNHELWNANKEKEKFAKYNISYNIDGIDYNPSNFDIHEQTEKGFCETQHFQYTHKQSSLVTNQTEINALLSEEEIKQAINWYINQQ